MIRNMDSIMKGSARKRGKITRWNEDRGFGFIRPSGGGSDVFVHARSFESDRKRSSNGEKRRHSVVISEGDLVEFEIMRNPRNGKSEAKRAKRISSSSRSTFGEERGRRKRQKKNAPPRPESSAERKEREDRQSFLYGGSSKSTKRPDGARTGSPAKVEMSQNRLAAMALRSRLPSRRRVSRRDGDRSNASSTTSSSVVRNETTESKRSVGGGAAAMLQQMLRDERAVKSRDFDKNWATNIAKSSGYKGPTSGSRSGADEADAQLDRTHTLALKRRRRPKEAASSSRRVHLPTTLGDRTQSRCELCIGSDAMRARKHLFVSVSPHASLQLRSAPLVPGHCRIAPREHVAAMTSASDEAWSDVKRYEDSLKKMIFNAGMSVILIETCLSGEKSTGRSSSRHHTFVDVIPVPSRIEEDAPIFFKKALTEVGAAWSQYRKIIHTTRQRSIQSCVPKDFAYVHVRWASPGRPDEGFARVIENADEFSHTFAHDVLAGMLGLESSRFDRHGKRKRAEESDRIERDVIQFSKRWSHFDWTRSKTDGA